LYAQREVGEFVSTLESANDVHGVLGLGFNSLEMSQVDTAVREAHDNAMWGASVLHNIFAQHPDQPNFVALDLARTADLEGTDGGSFGIGEYDDEYLAVANETKLYQFPNGTGRWTTLLEGVHVDGYAIELKPTLAGVPRGQHLALLETGDPTALLPTYLLDAIYSRIDGAEPFEYEDLGKVWVVPCNITTSVSFTFGGKEYPMHPLDLSSVYPVASENYTFCMSTMRGQDHSSPDFEVALGDVFLRNVYSVFDFGDPLPGGGAGAPYMQLLAQTVPEDAAAAALEYRAEALASHPPEMPPREVVELWETSGASQGEPALAVGNSARRIALIVGLSVLGVVLLAVVVGVFWVRRRRAAGAKLQAGRYMPLDVREK